MKRALLYLTAFVVPPLALGAATIAYRLAGLSVEPAPTFHAVPESAPSVGGGRPIAVVLLGNAGTEGSDFLVPFEILSRSGAFEVLVAAPERRVSPLTPVSVDVVPDYSLSELDAALGEKRPDLIVLPYLPNAAEADRAVLDWLEQRAGHGTVILTICGGSQVLAQTGLLDGRVATSHHDLVSRLEDDFPAVRWTRGLRWVDDGNVVSSGAILAGFDATLHVVRRLAGEEVARRVARELGYPHERFLEDPRYEPEAASLVNTALNLGFRWRLPVVGLPVWDGMPEVALAAVIDTYPHSFALRLESFAAERRVYRSLHGLALVPRRGGAGPADYSWTVVPEGGYDGRTFVFDASLRDVAWRYGRNVATAAARGLGYPVREENLTGPTWPLDPTSRPLLVGLAGALGLLIARRASASRRSAEAVR